MTPGLDGTAGLRGSFRHLPATFGLSVLLLAGPPPAAAQSNLLTVVCIGSEIAAVMGANQVPGTFRADEEIGYVTDVDPAYRQEAEQAVRDQLSNYARISCTWSGPADTHVMVVRFKAVFRRDDRMDPDDPRFTNFAIGFGTSWDDAEARATTLNERFATYQDGSRYGTVLQFRWGEAEEDPDRPVDPRPEPEDLFRDCDACPGMVVVPAGTFMMGSPDSEEGRERNEQPLHRVTIDSPFAVGAYEVTFGEWGACVLAGGCDAVETEDAEPEGDRYPVGSVTWVQAQAYVQWLSVETGERYRLLSEAEWEYVARAGTDGPRYWGDGEPGQCEHANAQDAEYLKRSPGRSAAACSDGYARAAPVGLYAANPFGLHDVLGNAREWTQDCWNPLYAGAPGDGSAWEEGQCTVRVVRGGSWGTSPLALRSAARSVNRINGSAGLRVARDLN